MQACDVSDAMLNANWSDFLALTSRPNSCFTSELARPRSESLKEVHPRSLSSLPRGEHQHSAPAQPASHRSIHTICNYQPNCCSKETSPSCRRTNTTKQASCAFNSAVPSSSQFSGHLKALAPVCRTTTFMLRNASSHYTEEATGTSVNFQAQPDAKLVWSRGGV